MPGCARRCSIGSPIRPTLSKQARSRTVFAGPCGRNAKSDPWRPLFHSASASPYGLRSSRTELYPLNLQRPKVGQIKPPKWAKPTCQKHHVEAIDSLCDSAANRFVLKATVYPSKDSAGFVGYGDADPSNVSLLVRGAEMRIAEARAVDRAL